MSVVTAKRLDASRITGGTHLIMRQPRVAWPMFTVWPSRVLASAVEARASARLPCWLNIRIARIGRGFHGLSNGCVAPRWRGNPGDARGAARGGAGDGPAGPGAGRHAGYARHGRRRHGRAGNESPAQSRSHRRCHLGSRLGRRHNSRLAGRGRPAHRRPLWHPGISGNRQSLAGQPRQSLRRRRRRYRETRSADVRHAECALRHRRLARRHQDQRRGTHRSVHGRKRANSRHRRDRARRETGEARARLRGKRPARFPRARRGPG